MSSQENYNLCRFCLDSSDAKPHSEFSDISETEVGRLFFELTQVKLKHFENYTKVCAECLKDLTHCVEVKNSFIDGQQQLEQSIKLSEIEIKIEVVEVEEGEDRDDGCDNNDEVYSDLVDDSVQSQQSDLAECPECSFRVPQETIGKHIARHFKQSPHACDKCEYKTDKSNRLEAHCLKVHNCQPPPKKSRKNESDVRKQCSLCGAMVKNLVEHLKITHGQLKRYSCDHCDYKCYFRAKIERHLQRHIPKQFQNCFKCELCDFQTNRKDTLKNHHNTMHQTNRERKEVCSYCQKSFFNKSQLNTHTRTVHEKIKNHLCNYCGKSFFTVKDLAMHEKRHFEKTVKCTRCESLFFCKVDLRRHMKTKHTTPSIVCEFPDCGKKFHSNSKLTVHVKTKHEQQKEYACKYSYCDSKFAQYNNLKRHVDTVHKAKRMKCAVDGCKYSASRKDKYKNHLVSQHKTLDEAAREKILKSAKYE